MTLYEEVLRVQLQQEKATNAELETTIDGLADLSRGLEKGLDKLRAEVEAAIVQLQGVLGTSVALLPDTVRLLINDLKLALEEDAL